MPARRLAIVSPWFGRELTGGAERLAYQVACAMRDRGHVVDVYTTCGRSFQGHWANDYYSPGTIAVDGVTVHRFSLDARHRDAFDRANAALLAQPPDALVPEAARVSPEVESAFVDETIRSRALEDALAAACVSGGVDRALFVPYLYGPTLFGVERAGSRAVLQPCLHDEAYAYLPRIAAPMHAASRVLFNGDAEMVLAARLFGPAMLAKGAVVGHWVEPPLEVSRATLRSPLARERYLLYLGRRDRSKNVHLLVQAYLDFKRYDPQSDLKLVLAGPGATSFARPTEGVLDFGFVTDEEKWSLIGAARAIAQPSENESFSRTMLEGWALQRPAIVHGRCGATAEAVRAANAGYVATTRAQWTQAIERLEAATASERSAYGTNGHAYFRDHSSSERVADRYEDELFGRTLETTSASPKASRGESPFVDAPRGRGSYDRTYWDDAPDVATMRRLAGRENLVVYAGERIDAADGVEDLVTAFAFLLSYGVEASLVVLGKPLDQNIRAELVATIERHGLTPRIDLVPNCDHAMANAYYRSARAFVSLADEPSSPIALVDACAFGVPVVALACETARQALGPAGVLLASKADPVRTAALLKVVLCDESVRSELDRGARARIG